MIYLLLGFITLVFSVFLIRQSKHIRQVHKAVSFIEEHLAHEEVMTGLREADNNEDAQYMKEVLYGKTT